MRKFFNSLTDSIVIINNQEKIIFVNDSFKTNMGNELQELDLNEISNQINIRNNEIAIVLKDKILRADLGEIHNIQWDGEAARAVLVKWKNIISDNVKSQLHERILDEMKEWICVKDLNNEFVYINKACLEHYNTTQEEAAVIIKQQLSHNKFNEIMVKYDEDVIKGKINCTYDIERENEGLKEYFEINKFPILNGEGHVEYIGMVCRDKSLEKNIQYKILDNLNLIDSDQDNENLKLNKVDESIFENFRRIFNKFLQTEHSNILIYDKNKQALRPQHPLERGTEEYRGKEYIPIKQNGIDNYLQGTYKKIIKTTERELGISDSDKPHYIVNYPIINQQEFKGVITMSYDKYPTIETERRDFIKSLCSGIGFIIKYVELSTRINEELRYRNNLESELEAFLDISADIIIKIDKTGVTEVGRSCFEVLGWTRDEFLSMSIHDLIYPEDLEKTLEIIRKQCESDESFEWENRMKCSNGLSKWISWRSRNLIDSKGYIFISGKDITCEKVITEHEKEIEKVKQLEEVRNEFFANISHEFKTPINLIMTTSQLLNQQLYRYDLNAKVEAEIKKYINTYRQNGYRLLKLVNNLIDITKIDAGFYKLKPINVNIINVIEDIVLSVAEYCKGNNIELIFDTEVEEEIIACDPDQIERIILNLLSNAIKYTPAMGQIRVNIGIETEFVVVIVEDTGRGIPSNKLDVIFERFVQCEDTFTRSCEGSGIGLSLVKGLVEIHGGNIEVTSEEGVGSTFQIRLPRKQADIMEIDPGNQEIRPSNIEKCSIEFADIYNL